MKLIISNKQHQFLIEESAKDSRILFFRRHYDELMKHLWDIIAEGFYHYDVCDYKEFKEYYDFIIINSVETFIYSYDELGGYNDDSMKEFLIQFTRNKYGNSVKQHWRERECE